MVLIFKEETFYRAILVSCRSSLGCYRLGRVITLNLLFGIPMIYASIFGALEVILILAITTRKFRILEQMFILFVSIISFGYLYEVFITKPDPSAILYHSIVPIIANSNALLITVGATVMRPALFEKKQKSNGRVCK